MTIKKSLVALAAPLAVMAGLSTPAKAQDFYIGQIIMNGYTFCQRNTTEAAGQLLAIASNTALFSLYGTTFGGDGRTTFALPDLRGRVPMGVGSGPGLTTRILGTKFGFEQVSLLTSQLPPHNHQVRVNNTGGDKRRPGNDYLSYSTLTEMLPPDEVEKMYATAPTPDTFLDAGSITDTGSGLPHENIQPVQVINYCVVLQGLFPSRN